MAVSGRIISLAVQAMLSSATGRSCGYGSAPTASSTPTGAAVPYSVLYPVGSTSDGPPFGDASADARIVYQVTSVATTAEQVEWMADKVRTGMLAQTPRGYAHAITAPGYVVMSRELDKEEGVTAASGVYSYIQRFAIEVTTLVA
ncbi:hypothetical protein [Streptomyces sp. MNP-20]|uniref:hypothetical protein n=1 Tax=Streptomyces sp. MNP-20 TaxID=2721165 RepID=UPI001553C1BF|nr:hypothetical protein [Streptomyces sp. MNP-20]